MKIKKHTFSISVICASLMMGGCGSAYSTTVGGSGLGAHQYIPSVYIEPGNEARYAQVLPICREAANNRQMTAAQEAQLKTLTGAVEGTVGGAASEIKDNQFLDIFGAGNTTGDSALLGAGLGLATSLASSFASGAEGTAAETKAALLKCLTIAGQNGKFWQVLE